VFVSFWAGHPRNNFMVSQLGNAEKYQTKVCCLLDWENIPGGAKEELQW